MRTDKSHIFDCLLLFLGLSWTRVVCTCKTNLGRGHAQLCPLKDKYGDFCILAPVMPSQGQKWGFLYFGSCGHKYFSNTEKESQWTHLHIGYEATYGLVTVLSFGDICKKTCFLYLVTYRILKKN